MKAQKIQSMIWREYLRVSKMKILDSITQTVMVNAAAAKTWNVLPGWQIDSPPALSRIQAPEIWPSVFNSTNIFLNHARREAPTVDMEHLGYLVSGQLYKFHQGSNSRKQEVSQSIRITEELLERHVPPQPLRPLLLALRRQPDTGYRQVQTSSGSRSSAKKRCATGCPKGDLKKMKEKTK